MITWTRKSLGEHKVAVEMRAFISYFHTFSRVYKRGFTTTLWKNDKRFLFPEFLCGIIYRDIIQKSRLNVKAAKELRYFNSIVALTFLLYFKFPGCSSELSSAVHISYSSRQEKVFDPTFSLFTFYLFTSVLLTLVK